MQILLEFLQKFILRLFWMVVIEIRHEFIMILFQEFFFNGITLRDLFFQKLSKKFP